MPFNALRLVRMLPRINTLSTNTERKLALMKQVRLWRQTGVLYANALFPLLHQVVLVNQLAPLLCSLLLKLLRFLITQGHVIINLLEQKIACLFVKIKHLLSHQISSPLRRWRRSHFPK